MAGKISKLWETIELDAARQISRAGALMLLALDDLRNVRELSADFAIGVWRRYCAANLTGQEWAGAAWCRQDADQNGKRALRELSEALHVADYGRVNPTAHHLLARLREIHAPAMPVQEFIDYCFETGNRVSKRIG